MALPWALAVLSLLPLLDAQDPACAPLKATPITNATLERISGKWFYIASVLRKPEYQQEARGIHAAFFYLLPNLTDDTILFREYQTVGDQCIYNASHGGIQRQNRTLSKTERNHEHFAYLWLTKDPETYILYFLPEEEQNKGVVFYARKQEVTEEQLKEFHEALKCLGLQGDEILYTDGKKDLCGPLDKQHEEERKKGERES
ncbi:alpha-1-acid glycoprotein-like [Dasypus novemcinctus]|uniref:alpha-1-acid glycoprotein-like n=1 Tax=Dasypus novemcinctus TaxID=9361 RepID=UPI00265E4E3A|nr:alpha-1-acid glycoprotein-like [Dasypus novemcinctus]